MDLLTIHYVSVVSTQGSVAQNSWVSSYLVHYSLDGKEWIVLTDKGGEIKVCFWTVRILQTLHWGVDWVDNDHPFGYYVMQIMTAKTTTHERFTSTSF